MYFALLSMSKNHIKLSITQHFYMLKNLSGEGLKDYSDFEIGM